MYARPKRGPAVQVSRARRLVPVLRGDDAACADSVGDDNDSSRYTGRSVAIDVL